MILDHARAKMLAMLASGLLATGALGACAGEQAESPGDIEAEQDTDAPAGLEEDTREEQDGVGENPAEDNPQD